MESVSLAIVNSKHHYGASKEIRFVKNSSTKPFSYSSGLPCGGWIPWLWLLPLQSIHCAGVKWAAEENSHYCNRGCRKCFKMSVDKKGLSVAKCCWDAGRA